MTNLLPESASHLSIVKALYFNGAISCSDISKIIGASIPNVSKNLDELIDGGYVIEKGFAESKGGRKPLVYSLVAGKFYIVSVAMDQFQTRIAIVDLDNSFVKDIECFDFNLYDASSDADPLVRKINSFIDHSGISKKEIYGIGIAMPGFFDISTGTNKTFLRNDGKSIRDYIAGLTGLPTFIDNDSSAIALAELKFGVGRTRKEIMVINIGWGIGLGMIVNGEIFRGFSGFAGEFSHIPLFKNGRICSCGKRGCLETEVSLTIIEQKAQKAISAGEYTTITANENGKVTISSILAEANKGDHLAIKLISEAGYNIGQGIAVLIHIMNPQTIVLSGKGSEAGNVWLAPIQQALNELCIPALLNKTEVILSPLGSNAQLIGAAALVVDNIDR
jgi:predicted NBD/HSP70 family sugar kinase